MGTAGQQGGQSTVESVYWLRVVRTYFAVIGAGNLLWEIAQFPLYMIWRDGTRSHILLALTHGTVGDLLISAAALMAALVIFGHSRWPNEAFGRVGAADDPTGTQQQSGLPLHAVSLLDGALGGDPADDRKRGSDCRMHVLSDEIDERVGTARIDPPVPVRPSAAPIAAPYARSRRSCGM